MFQIYSRLATTADFRRSEVQTHKSQFDPKKEKQPFLDQKAKQERAHLVTTFRLSGFCKKKNERETEGKMGEGRRPLPSPQSQKGDSKGGGAKKGPL